MHFYTVWQQNKRWTGVAAVNTSGNCSWSFVFQLMNVVSQHGGHAGSVRAATRLTSSASFIHIIYIPLTSRLRWGCMLYQGRLPTQQTLDFPWHMLWWIGWNRIQMSGSCKCKTDHLYKQTLNKVIVWHFGEICRFFVRYLKVQCVRFRWKGFIGRNWI